MKFFKVFDILLITTGVIFCSFIFPIFILFGIRVLNYMYLNIFNSF